jgi:hypothetical protein
MNPKRTYLRKQKHVLYDVPNTAFQSLCGLSEMSLLVCFCFVGMDDHILSQSRIRISHDADAI